MASTGLSGLISNTGTQTTTLPSWYDTAQQNVVSQATAANAAAPQPSQTVAQNAVNALSGPTNAFTNAGDTLQSIASGAANPWNVGANGQVTPNTNTALGGLFQAQNQQLNQILPQTVAPVEASNIGSGNFGSLRGQTAMDVARGNAEANLFASQNQAALQNQATGVNAGVGAGNVAQENINNLLTTGQYQQSSPYTNAANYANVIGAVTPGATVSNTTQLSPLNQVAGIASLLGGSGVGAQGLLGSLFGQGSAAVGTPGSSGYQSAISPGLFSSNGPFSGLGNYISNGFSSTSNGGSGLPTGITQIGANSFVDSSGQAVDAFGNPAFLG